MTPGTYDWTIYQGASFGPLTFTFKDDNGDVIDLTGLTAYAQARTAYPYDDCINLNPEITDPASGEVTMSFTLTQVQAMPAGEFLWDMTFAPADGERVGPYVQGTLTVQPIATRPN